MMNPEEQAVPTAMTFTIHDEASAGWVLRKIAAAESEMARVKAQAAARIGELQTEAAALHARFDADLQVWAEQEAARRRRKSVTLLDGTLAFRTVPARLKIADENEATCWAYENQRGDLYDVVHKARPALLEFAQEHFEETGELLPGIEHLPSRESFSIKFSNKGNSDNE